MDFTVAQLAKESSPSSVVVRLRHPGTRAPAASHGDEDRRGNKILGFLLF